MKATLLLSVLALLGGLGSQARTTSDGNRPVTGNLSVNDQTVGGKIEAKGGMYAVNYGGQWPDYVFSPSYHLRPLAKVAQFIEATHHLPDVPSAAQVQTEGLELTAMNAVLQKVEELKLHLIELAKANQALTVRVAQLEAAK